MTMIIISRKSLRLLFTLLLFMPGLYLSAQNYEEAEELFEQGYFEEAKVKFHDLYYSDMDNNLYKYRLGLCYLFTQEEEEALRLIIQVDPLEDKREELHRTFYLARVLHLDHKFEEASAYYKKYIDTYKKYPEEFDETLEHEVVLPAIYGGSAHLIDDPLSIDEAINRLIEECSYGSKLSENPTRVAIKNAGDRINSPRPEYAPVINASGDEIFFTSKIGVGGGEYAERLFHSKVTADKEWGVPEEIKITDDPLTDIAPLYMAPTSDFGLIYDSRSNHGDIFPIVKNGNAWEEGESFPKTINSKFWEPSASMFPDRKILVFSSNRPEGYGGLDLYMSVKNENGKWEDPVNLGPKINTPFDEDAPFILYDEPKMYFSSRGHNCIGGYDIFVTSYLNGEWTEPENLKMPINTAQDDIYFTWTEDGRRAFFASHRLGTRGATDIYYMDFRQISLNVFVKEESNTGIQPLHDFEVSLKHMKTGELAPNMNRNEEKGLSVFLASEDEMYMLRVQAPGHITYVESMRLRRGNEFIAYQNKEVILKQDGQPVYEEVEVLEEKPKVNAGKFILIGDRKLFAGDMLNQKVHFLLNESKNITDYSKKQMDQVIDLMNQNPGITIQIIAHSDLSGDEEYNNRLSREREISVKSYLMEKGIAENRIVETWKGEKEPLVNTESPELRNRRVEFYINSL